MKVFVKLEVESKAKFRNMLTRVMSDSIFLIISKAILDATKLIAVSGFDRNILKGNSFNEPHFHLIIDNESRALAFSQ